MLLLLTAALFSGPTLAHPYAPTPDITSFKGREVTMGVALPEIPDPTRGDYAVPGDEFCGENIPTLPPTAPTTLVPTSFGYRSLVTVPKIDALWVEQFPDITSPVLPVTVTVPPDWDHWSDYAIKTRQTRINVADLYWAENLTDNEFGLLKGDSYMIPAFMLHDPRPWWWTGGTTGLPLYFVSFDFNWTLGEVSDFDGGWDVDAGDVWQGTSGKLDGFVNNSNPSTETPLFTQYPYREPFAGEETVTLYYAPLLISHFGRSPTDSYPDWPSGVRCYEPGDECFKGDEVGVGHDGLWPWGHSFEHGGDFIIEFHRQ